ncbi:SAP domain-containing protein [Paenibacillus sp. 32352]|uniref:SAP domain-containing protein n=1 Tax=Paenibacillus sp. 32352 TaxID=1969111 RepID=UPI0009ABFC5F|nr:SAP domain-containing protein [Paenibacillus sp. 32352]
MRPDFSLEMTIEQFEHHYWYKKELEELCRNHGISSAGTKAELEQRIKNVLSGKTPVDSRKMNSAIRKRRQAEQPLSLHTKLIPEGFKFNAKAREFFAHYYKVPKFSFTKEMAAALREAERQGDMDMTVSDLIAIYEGPKLIQGPEERTYQWNYFVKEFNKDPLAQGLKQDRMKIAAELWKLVRDNPDDKQYSTTLLANYLKKQEG